MMRRSVLIGASVGLVMVVGAADVSAQPQTAITDTALQFIGVWTRDTSVPRGDCGGAKDQRGNLIEDCSTPMAIFR